MTTQRTHLGLEVGTPIVFPHVLIENFELIDQLILTQKAVVAVEHADILLLPTTPVEILAAPEAGFVRVPIKAAMQSVFAAALTNVDTGATLHLTTGGHASLVAVDAADLAVTGYDVVLPVDVKLTDATEDAGVALLLAASNGAKGDFTGGHVANQLIVTVWFIEVALAGARAFCEIGSGANGTIQLAVEETGVVGNDYDVEVVEGDGLDLPLTVALLPTTTLGGHATTDLRHLVVTLATDGSGDPDDTANTALLIATAITDAGLGFLALATGTGVTPISAAEGPTSFANGL